MKNLYVFISIVCCVPGYAVVALRKIGRLREVPGPECRWYYKSIELPRTVPRVERSHPLHFVLRAPKVPSPGYYGEIIFRSGYDPRDLVYFCNNDTVSRRADKFISTYVDYESFESPTDPRREGVSLVFVNNNDGKDVYCRAEDPRDQNSSASVHRIRTARRAGDRRVRCVVFYMDGSIVIRDFDIDIM